MIVSSAKSDTKQLKIPSTNSGEMLEEEQQSI